MKPQIICITGKAQNGKTTTANLLQVDFENHGKTTLVMNYGDLVKFIAKEYFKWNGKKDEAGRTLLQIIGTEYVRKKRPNYWVDFIVDLINMMPVLYDVIIIGDCRFPNEISRVKDAGFDVTTIKVDRPGYDNGLTEAQKNHPSEKASENIPFDRLFINDGTIEDLRNNYIIPFVNSK